MTDVGPIITDEEASSVFKESPSLELLTPKIPNEHLEGDWML